MDAFLYVNFLIATVVLLASPGPAYATVVSIGRSAGWRAGQTFNVGLQIGMGLVAALTAFGLATLILLYPSIKATLGLLGATYLLYLAAKIAFSPVGKKVNATPVPASFWAGVLVGVTNPKAYAAQSSLFASFTLLPHSTVLDGSVKWITAVLIMTIAGIAWLWVGAKLGQMAMSPAKERGVNLVFAAAIVTAGAMSLLS